MRERTHLETELKAIKQMNQELEDNVELLLLGEIENDTTIVNEAEIEAKKVLSFNEFYLK